MPQRHYLSAPIERVGGVPQEFDPRVDLADKPENMRNPRDEDGWEIATDALHLGTVGPDGIWRKNA